MVLELRCCRGVRGLSTWKLKQWFSNCGTVLQVVHRALCGFSLLHLLYILHPIDLESYNKTVEILSLLDHTLGTRQNNTDEVIVCKLQSITSRLDFEIQPQLHNNILW